MARSVMAHVGTHEKTSGTGRGERELARLQGRRVGLGLTERPTWLLWRRRPETSTLYHVVQENLDTLYGALEDRALAIALPKF